MIHLDIKMKGVKEYVRALERYAKKAVPHAARNAVNRAAFLGRKEWIGEARRQFVVRNNFTDRSIQVEKARGTRDATAILGSTAEYMARREEGGKHSATIPTVSGARGNIKRLVKPSNKMRSIQLGKRVKRGSRKQQNAASIAMAKRSGNRYAFIQTAKGGGIVQIGRGNARPKMIWRTGQPGNVEAMPTLATTLKRIEKEVEAIHIAALREQLRRHGLM